MALSVVERISIGAPAARVWAAIRNFDGLQDWHPAVAASPADKANAEGSVRKLSLQGGGAVVETLTYIMEDGGPLPVAGYRSTIAVSADGAGSQVEWRGEFSAAPGTADGDATQTMRGVYRGGLESLKGKLEG